MTGVPEDGSGEEGFELRTVPYRHCNGDSRGEPVNDDEEVASGRTTESRVSVDRRAGHARPDERRGSRVNIRQANGIGRVHVAKPQMKQTYCGRPVDDEDWVTTSKEANCTGCARAGAPRPEDARR